MFTLRCTIGAALLLALGAAPVPPDRVKEEKQKLRGTWKVVARDRDGKPAAAGDFKGTTYQFTDDKVIRRRAGEDELAYPYHLDPGQTPRQIDLFVPWAMLADARHRGIYRLKGDRLEVCYVDRFNGERPKDFKGARGLVLLTLERQKP